MATENTTTIRRGFGLGTIVFAIFLTLKLAEVGQVAHWSWWWVTSPLWIPLAAVLAFLLVCVVIAGIVKVFKQLH